jgi:hypothetical protein
MMATGIGRNPLETSVASREPWYDIDDPVERARSIKQIVEDIDDDQCGWQEMTLSHLRMYRNFAMMGLGPYSYATADAAMGAPLSFNVVRSMVNTVHAKLTKDRPRATFQTYGATYKQKRLAELLGRYAEGLCYQEKLWEKMKPVALDLLVTGTGVLKVCEAKGHVAFDHVFSPNLKVDSVEGMYRTPANYYETIHISRGKLAKLFPNLKDKIATLRTAAEDDDGYAYHFIPERRSTDIVRVIEAYHLSSEEGANDGEVTLSSGDLELSRGTWVSIEPPYCIARWSTSNLGFYGMGLAEELKGIQVEINRLVRKIQLSFALLGNPYVLAERNSNIAKGSITDIPGSIITYSGMKEPRVVAPQTVHPEIFAHLDRLYNRAYEIAGVSQMSASLRPPQAFESGRAQLIYEDAEDNRFASVFLEWEAAHLKAIEMAIKIARTIKGYKVKVWGDDSHEELDFSKDIGLKDSEYVMRVMPRSYISGTPAEQINEAERLVKAGLVASPEEALENVEAPDIQAIVSRKTSPKRLIEKMVQSMLDGGPQLAPEPQMNLSLANFVALEMYNEAKQKEYPAAALRKVRNFLIACTRLHKMGNQGGESTQPAAPPVQPMSPTGEGAAAAPGPINPMAA